MTTCRFCGRPNAPMGICDDCWSIYVDESEEEEEEEDQDHPSEATIAARIDRARDDMDWEWSTVWI